MACPNGTRVRKGIGEFVWVNHVEVVCDRSGQDSLECRVARLNPVNFVPFAVLNTASFCSSLPASPPQWSALDFTNGDWVRKLIDWNLAQVWGAYCECVPPPPPPRPTAPPNGKGQCYTSYNVSHRTVNSVSGRDYGVGTLSYPGKILGIYHDFSLASADSGGDHHEYGMEYQVSPTSPVERRTFLSSSEAHAITITNVVRLDGQPDDCTTSPPPGTPPPPDEPPPPPPPPPPPGEKGEKGDKGDMGDKGDKGDDCVIEFVNTTVAVTDCVGNQSVTRYVTVPSLKGDNGTQSALIEEIFKQFESLKKNPDGCGDLYDIVDLGDFVKSGTVQLNSLTDKVLVHIKEKPLGVGRRFGRIQNEPDKFDLGGCWFVVNGKNTVESPLQWEDAVFEVPRDATAFRFWFWVGVKANIRSVVKVKTQLP